MENKELLKQLSLAQETIEKQKKEIEELKIKLEKCAIRKITLMSFAREKEKAIAELESKLEQSVNIGVVSELSETIENLTKKLEHLESFTGVHISDSFSFSGCELVDQITEARKLINMIMESDFIYKNECVVMKWEEKAKAWLEQNK